MRLISAKSSIVICLGQLLGPNGSLPFTLMNRVNKVIDLITPVQITNNKLCNDVVINPDCIIFSGTEVQKCGKTEAQAMWEHFQTKVSCKDISPAGSIITKSLQNVKYFNTQNTTVVLEERATNTLENVLFSKEIIDTIVSSQSPTTIYIVTNDFHCPRALILAKQFLKEYSCIDIPASSYPPQSCKESFNSTKLFESIAWERRALTKLNQQLDLYKLHPVSMEIITWGIKQLDSLEQSFDSK